MVLRKKEEIDYYSYINMLLKYRLKKNQKNHLRDLLGMVTHASNPSHTETEAVPKFEASLGNFLSQNKKFLKGDWGCSLVVEYPWVQSPVLGEKKSKETTVTASGDRKEGFQRYLSSKISFIELFDTL